MLAVTQYYQINLFFFFYRLNHFAKYGKMFPKIMENVNLIFVKVINIIKLGISQLPDLSAA